VTTHFSAVDGDHHTHAVSFEMCGTCF